MPVVVIVYVTVSATRPVALIPLPSPSQDASTLLVLAFGTLAVFTARCAKDCLSIGFKYPQRATPWWSLSSAPSHSSPGLLWNALLGFAFVVTSTSTQKWKSQHEHEHKHEKYGHANIECTVFCPAVTPTCLTPAWHFLVKCLLHRSYDSFIINIIIENCAILRYYAA